MVLTLGRESEVAEKHHLLMGISLIAKTQATPVRSIRRHLSCTVIKQSTTWLSVKLEPILTASKQETAV
jgi:hypothetical protein